MEALSYIVSFHQILSATVISTDKSQVGVALFPSFNIFYQVINSELLPVKPWLWTTEELQAGNHCTGSGCGPLAGVQRCLQAVSAVW